MTTPETHCYVIQWTWREVFAAAGLLVALITFSNKISGEFTESKNNDRVVSTRLSAIEAAIADLHTAYTRDDIDQMRLDAEVEHEQCVARQQSTEAEVRELREIVERRPPSVKAVPQIIYRQAPREPQYVPPQIYGREFTPKPKTQRRK